MKIALLYLAAGNSRRFGENKLLYEVGGLPLYRHLLDRLRSVTARHDNWELIIVTRYPQILEESAEHDRERVVYSPESHRGISYTIRAGVNAAKDAEVCAFFTADQPFLREETAEAFLLAMEEQQAEMGSVIHKGEPGNPTWFSAKYFPALLALKEDQGGRKILRQASRVHYYPVDDPKELEDIDTKQTLKDR